MDAAVYSSPTIVRVGNQNVLYIGTFNSLSSWTIELGGIEPGLARTSWPCDRGNLKRNGRMYMYFLGFQALTKLMLHVHELHLGNFATSLGAKLELAKQSLERDELVPARDKLKAFINEVRALKEKKIPVREAASLIADAQGIMSELQ